MLCLVRCLEEKKGIFFASKVALFMLKALQLNFELQHFPVRQLAGPDRSGNLPDRMVKHLACYLTDHKQ